MFTYSVVKVAVMRSPASFAGLLEVWFSAPFAATFDEFITVAATLAGVGTFAAIDAVGNIITDESHHSAVRSSAILMNNLCDADSVCC